jgi:tight adherence protein B
MFAALLVFVVVAGLILAAFALTVWARKALAEQQLHQRLLEINSSVEPDQGDSTLIKEQAAGPVPALDKLLAATNASAGLSKLIEQAAVNMTPGGVVVVSVALAAGAAAVCSVFAANTLLIALAGAAGLAAPTAWLVRRRSQRLKKFEEQFPEALDLLSRAIRAGHAFQTSLGMVAQELPAPVGPEFKKTFDQQNFGLPLRDAMNQLSDRVPILDVRFFVTAVAIQRDTGGNLAEILDNLSAVVRERFKIRRQVRVHTAHGRFTGYVLLALPAFLALMLSQSNPETMQLLFRERIGQMMLAGAIVLQAVGFVWIRQIIKIEV